MTSIVLHPFLLPSVCISCPFFAFATSFGNRNPLMGWSPLLKSLCFTHQCYVQLLTLGEHSQPQVTPTFPSRMQPHFHRNRAVISNLWPNDDVAPRRRRRRFTLRVPRSPPSIACRTQSDSESQEGVPSPLSTPLHK